MVGKNYTGGMSVPLNQSAAAVSNRHTSQGLMRLGYPPVLNWMLLAYAVVAVAIGWAFAASRSHADFERTLEGERSRLRGVAAALQAGTLAMLNDGVGAAVAGANELQSEGDSFSPVELRLSARCKNISRVEVTCVLFSSPTGSDLPSPGARAPPRSEPPPHG